MQRVVIDPVHPEPRKVKFAVEHLTRGDVLAYPTDTVYGFGCDMTEKAAVERLYQLKQMREDRKLAFLFPDLTEVSQYAVLSDLAYHVCKRILPGPYTVVLPAKRWVPRALMDKRKQVGVRIPEHPITQAMLRELGRPIVSTSVTFEGVPLGDPEDVRDHFEHGIDILVDGGLCDTAPSTVISLIDDQLEIIREGKGPIDVFDSL
jgi:tRNA threonylcarbamoyl adenosine modification protein (Sua5/YciO/YrdC/YwlC family)